VPAPPPPLQPMGKISNSLSTDLCFSNHSAPKPIFDRGSGRRVWQCRWVLGRQMDWGGRWVGEGDGLGGRWVGDDIKIEIFYIPVSSINLVSEKIL